MRAHARHMHARRSRCSRMLKCMRVRQMLGCVALPLSVRLGFPFKLTVRESTGLGALFLLEKIKSAVMRKQSNPEMLMHVFQRTSGVYIIACMHFHDEDIGQAGAEGIPHYITYNAGTGLLFLYPEVSAANRDRTRDGGVWGRCSGTSALFCPSYIRLWR
jgi:hypothetical protein